jgi:hypothetical protein
MASPWTSGIGVKREVEGKTPGVPGLAFYTKAHEPLDLPSGTDLVQAKSIWVPGG